MLHRRKIRTSTRQQTSRATRRRSGVLTFELVLVLPILFIVLMAVFEFSILFFARASVVQACRVAARQASLGMTDTEQLDAVVRRVLSPNLQGNHQVLLIPAQRSGEITTVALRVPMAQAAPDLLWPVGFSLQGRYLAEEISVVRE